MPWRETAPMKERMRFVTDWERDPYSMVELCERYGVSRKTGHKWIARYPGVVPPTPAEPNDLWPADFKGHFRTRDGLYCWQGRNPEKESV